jgi:hypothetical protein
MSLKTKCFATLIGSEVFIHERMFELETHDFFQKFTYDRDQDVFSIAVEIGEGSARRSVFIDLPKMLTDYSSKRRWHEPIPLERQMVAKNRFETEEFKYSRFWLFHRYFFLTNRPYESGEENEVKMHIILTVRSFLNSIDQGSNFIQSFSADN